MNRFLSFVVIVVVLIATPATCVGSAPPERALNVGFLVVDGVYNSELIAPYDIFHHVRFHADPGMEVFTVGRTKDPVTTFEGLRIAVDYDLDDAPRIDVLVVPSAEHSMDRDLDDERLITWVRERGRDARYCLSLCDGAFVLARAGLLDNVRSTTFPGDVAAYRTRFPKLTVVDAVSFVADGRFLTGAGGARSYDPAMYLVEHLYGADAAGGVARGMAIDWDAERVRRYVTIDRSPEASAPGGWLPGDRVDAGVFVEDAAGGQVTLARLVASRPDTQAVVLTILAGGEANESASDGAQRAGFWCEDTFSEVANLRYLNMRYADDGVLFVGVLCPPVHHEARFGYDEGAFQAPVDDPAYTRNRERFVAACFALRRSDLLPFDIIAFDTRMRLLSRTALTESVPWQGKFKWHEDDQTYGTPTTWVLTPELEVVGPAFYKNVYESEGRKLRYTPDDIARAIDVTLKRGAGS